MRKWLIGVLLFCVACQKRTGTVEQSHTSGSVTIMADESFAPIVEDELFIFRDNYPGAEVKLLYKPESELLNEFLNARVRIAILSRMLHPEEKKAYENKNIKIRVIRFAIDGIALITHQSVKDSTVTVDEIINIMRGKTGNIKSLVFDNANSSTVRYLKELSGIKVLPASGVYALKSNPEVIKFVSANPGAIGVVGVNWIELPSKDNEQYTSKLRIMGVKNTAGKPGDDKFYKPDQNNLALGLYPLTRNLYFINCQGGPGIGEGFASFLASEKGQRIVLKSGLLPDKIPTRKLNIKKTIF